MKGLIFILILITGLGFGWDFFKEKEHAVGYIIIEKDGKERKFIVLKKNGAVELMEVEIDLEELIIEDKEGKER